MNPPLDPRRIELLDPATVMKLKMMSPIERLASGFALRERVRTRQIAHFRSVHSDWTDDRIERAAAQRMLLASLNKPTRVIIRLMSSLSKQGSTRHMAAAEAMLRTDGHSLNRGEVEFFASCFDVLDIWQAIVARVDSAPLNNTHENS